MTKKNIGSHVGFKALSAAGVLALGAAVLTGCAPAEDLCDPGEPVEGEIRLNLGSALPLTGNLAFLGPPEEAGALLAVCEINAAGLGISIKYTPGDSGDTDNKAYDTEIPRLLSAGVDAIVGAASSGVSLQFIDRVVAEGVILFSPANTSAAFTTYDDKGLYFRTAPSDVLQGEVLGNLIAEDGHQRISMIVLNDSYGTGLAGFVTQAFEAAGGEVIAAPTYNTGDTNFTSQISEALAGDPDAIVLITFDEAKTIVPELTSQFPGEKLYFVDGNLTNYSEDFAPGTLEGAKGTYPGVNEANIASFVERLDTFWEERGKDPLELYAYGPETYDAVVLLALAALEAQSSEGVDMASTLQEVSGGSGDGTKCSTFAECAAIITAGGTADYDGPSGPVTFNEVGDPTEGNILIQQFDGNNVPATIRG